MTLERKLDFPTEGKPIRATRASPDFITSKPLTGFSGLLLRLEQLMSELGDLGTQLNEMVPVREGVDQGNQYWIGRVGSSKRRVHLLCCLVLLGPCDLIFELLDLFDDTHIDGSGCAKQVVGMLLRERDR